MRNTGLRRRGDFGKRSTGQGRNTRKLRSFGKRRNTGKQWNTELGNRWETEKVSRWKLGEWRDRRHLLALFRRLINFLTGH